MTATFFTIDKNQGIFNYNGNKYVINLLFNKDIWLININILSKYKAKIYNIILNKLL